MPPRKLSISGTSTLVQSTCSSACCVSPDSNTGKILIGHGIDINIVRETIAKESAHAGDPTNVESRAVAAQRHIIEVSIVPEETSQPLQIHWEKRIPAVGEIISIDQDRGKAAVYQIVKLSKSNGLSRLSRSSRLISPRFGCMLRDSPQIHD